MELFKCRLSMVAGLEFCWGSEMTETEQITFLYICFNIIAIIFRAICIIWPSNIYPNLIFPRSKFKICDFCIKIMGCSNSSATALGQDLLAQRTEQRRGGGDAGGGGGRGHDSLGLGCLVKRTDLVVVFWKGKKHLGWKSWLFLVSKMFWQTVFLVSIPFYLLYTIWDCFQSSLWG